MPVWRVICPHCSVENQVTKDSVLVQCGLVECTCTCTNCHKEFIAQQEYWRWLGLDRGPAVEAPDPGV